MSSYKHNNPPGLSELRYRVGTHPDFLQRMKNRLQTQEVAAEQRPLAALRADDTTDPTIALLDAWATVADVLTFYQERIANEGYLRTATERRSVLEMTRAIGYELQPGLAASTHLAFTVEDAVDPDAVVNIPRGTQVQSIPQKGGEMPQTFETSIPFTARSAWNVLKPQLTQEKPIAMADVAVADDAPDVVLLQGTETQLQPGSPILLLDDADSTRWRFGRVQTVTTRPAHNVTRVTWQPIKDSETGVTITTPTLIAFRQQSALYGHNAPDWRTMPETIKIAYGGANKENWPDFQIQEITQHGTRVGNQVDLDRVVPEVMPGSWLVLVEGDHVTLLQAKTVSTTSRVDYTLVGQVTRIVPQSNDDLSSYDLRATSVQVQSEVLPTIDPPSLPPQQVPITTPVEGSRITLDRVVPGFPPGTPLIISGRVAGSGQQASEVVRVAGVWETIQHTTIMLREPLQYRFERTTVSLYGNVVPATHGKTVSNEILGSGDGTQPNQRFALRSLPLTYVPQASFLGAANTLNVYVDGILWHQTESLYHLSPDSRSYMVRLDSSGRPWVIFGDGESGARLPTGVENVTATYRSGLGPEGNVAAGSLTLLPNRPLGIREVTNPLPSSGGVAPEQVEEARITAPRRALLLNRIVSLQDLEEFAGTFPGIDKAQSAILWNGQTYLLHVTVAGPQGAEIRKSSALYQQLSKAIEQARPPAQGIQIASYEPLDFKLEARVRLHPEYQWELVQPAIKTNVLHTFAFDKRAFGQDVRQSEVLAAIQAVEGVVAVDVDFLYRGYTRTLQPILEAHQARWDSTTIRPAQLLRLNARNITLIPWRGIGRGKARQ